MDVNDIVVEKSPTGIHVETVSDDVATKLEGEIFSGISMQTVLAFLVRLSLERESDPANVSPCRLYARS